MNDKLRNIKIPSSYAEGNFINQRSGGVGTSGENRRHLHGYKSHYALHRSVVKKTTHTRRANSLIGCCPDLGSLFTTGPCVYPNHRKTSGRETSARHLPTHRRLRLE
ncbi:hypothetical protein TNCV_3195951 [Trichonephila clavipes]|nr:hypothetical protein TNCV_3195951 [Trichonephila clavipes]